MDLKEAVSIVMKRERKRNDMSQEELACLSNVDRTYISLIERKKRNPTLGIIFRISYAFDMNPSDFIKMIEEVMEFSLLSHQEQIKKEIQS